MYGFPAEEMSDSKLNTDLSITTFSVVGTQEHLGDPFIHSSFVKGDLHSFITVACMILIISPVRHASDILCTYMINRPGVSGAVLQTALSLIN